MVLKMYATGLLHLSGSSCIRTAPKPKAEASAETVVGFVGPYNASGGK